MYSKEEREGKGITNLKELLKVPQWQIGSIEVDDIEIRRDNCTLNQNLKVGMNNKQIHKSQ